MSRRLAIIGAGPIGLEMALEAVDAGFDVRLYEAGAVGEHLARLGNLRFFTPFSMNSTDATRRRLRQAGVELPSDDDLAVDHFVARYLRPIAALPELWGRIWERACVTGIARDGVSKPRAIPTHHDPGRGRHPFALRIETPEGSRIDGADVVVDASGILAQPLATGPGGLEAPGESSLRDQVVRRLLALEDTRRSFEGLRVLLIGSGHSAATALVMFAELARSNRGPAQVVWIHRQRGSATPFASIPDDPLRSRDALIREANRVAAGAPWLSRRPGSSILAYEPGDGGIRATLRAPDGALERAEVDRVYALVGCRPDTELFRELQIHLCYATEGPMALASALLAARSSDPSRSSDCLAQTTHGAESLRTTEPGFFILGAKSYGRSPDFLLRVGYEQVRELIGHLTRASGFAVSRAGSTG